mmetsp:Transcript_8036/g.18708  ORF Transcript_8036/g.18708 Transcript_8036/m.18708 type:complete len:208 (-) Transcript_8036:1802-2425(-)
MDSPASSTHDTGSSPILTLRKPPSPSLTKVYPRFSARSSYCTPPSNGPSWKAPSALVVTDPTSLPLAAAETTTPAMAGETTPEKDAPPTALNSAATLLHPLAPPGRTSALGGLKRSPLPGASGDTTEDPPRGTQCVNSYTVPPFLALPFPGLTGEGEAEAVSESEASAEGEVTETLTLPSEATRLRGAEALKVVGLPKRKQSWGSIV